MDRLRTAIALTAGLAVVVAGGVAYAGTVAPQAPPAGVYFQDDGHIAGWDNKNPKPQKKGVIRDVSAPVYKGNSAIETQQTYISSDGKNYHTETVHARAQSLNQDRYYGQAVYVKPTWKVHSQPVTFQQFSPENPGGPWLLFQFNGSEITYSTRKTGYRTVGDFAALRGTWIRIVVRINMTKSGGVMEVWLNGRKVVSDRDNAAPPRGTTLRWSSGIYPNYWDTEAPKGDRVLSVFHDQARIASTYELAEPANW
jgi:hypothetical protein